MGAGAEAKRLMGDFAVTLAETRPRAPQSLVGMVTGGRGGTGERGEVESFSKTLPLLVISCGQNTHEWFWQK